MWNKWKTKLHSQYSSNSCTKQVLIAANSELQKNQPNHNISLNQGDMRTRKIVPWPIIGWASKTICSWNANRWSDFSHVRQCGKNFIQPKLDYTMTSESMQYVSKRQLPNVFQHSLKGEPHTGGGEKKKWSGIFKDDVTFFQILLIN